MPLYEYKCGKCESVFEVMQKFSDEPLTVHEGCGGEVEKLISSPAFQFKGSGWYITDYAKSGSGKSNGKSGSSSNGESSKAETSKTESTKSETKSASASTASKDSSPK
jgi:putative FmdB family regulatory protein